MEFIVIVVGVLAALAVDEWRETSHEGSLREEYLHSLAEEITTEISYLDFVAELSRDRIAAADRVLLFLGQPAGASSTEHGYEAPHDFNIDSIAVDLSNAMMMQFFVPEAVVWEDLAATGNLRLFDDAGLRRGVSRYYSQIRYQVRDLDQLHRRFEALSSYLLSAGISGTSRAGVEGHVLRLSSLSQLPAYLRSARDTQAEVLLRTLELREYAQTALSGAERGAA